MIRGRAIFVDASETQVTISITASVAEWRMVQDQISNLKYPSYQISSLIWRLLDKKLEAITETVELS